MKLIKKFFFSLIFGYLCITGFGIHSITRASGGGLKLNTSYTDGIDIYGTSAADNATDPKDVRLMKTIKNAINRTLGILGLIVFVLLLWGGFQMVTANGDDKKFSSGLTILKQAGLGLFFISISRLLVSMIFYVINQNIVKN